MSRSCTLLTLRTPVGRVVAASIVALIVVAGGGSAAFGRGAHHRHHGHAAARGIDVSHYQGDIDWDAVAGDGVLFAYIKATEGEDGRDGQFTRNWRGARRAGVRAGAYHFFYFCRSPQAQAHNFLAVAPRGSLAPAVDLEMESRCGEPLSGVAMRRRLDAYLAIVERREGRHAVLYTTKDFYAAYRAYLPHRPMWRRSVRSAPTERWAFWQYSSAGHVAGIQTFVDLNMGASAAHRR